MPVIFFSGGLDSTTLAWDISKCPDRYGVSREGDPVLHLVSYAMGHPQQKRAQLASLVKAIRARSVLPVRHQVFDAETCGFEAYEPALPVIQGSVQLYPSTGGKEPRPMTQRMRAKAPYTAGVHLWLASIAANICNHAERPEDYTREQAYWGFQFEGTMWESYDAGEMVPNDTTPEFIASLNEVSGHAGHRHTLWHRAPFLENRMDRIKVLRMALEIGVPVDQTSSCNWKWRGSCGHCVQCLRRGQAFGALRLLGEIK